MHCGKPILTGQPRHGLADKPAHYDCHLKSREKVPFDQKHLIEQLEDGKKKFNEAVTKLRRTLDKGGFG